jgi:hypothetical protein
VVKTWGDQSQKGDIANVEMKNIEAQAINFNSYYEREATGKSPLFRNICISDVQVDGARTAIEMIGLPEKWLENINIERARFENVQNGAVAHRVKELRLDRVSIKSSGCPLALEDVFEATIENVDLSGQRPLLLVGGSESGQIRVQGLTRDEVECAPHVPPAAVVIGGPRLP